MDVYEAIEKRRTVRGFTGGVSEEMLRKLLVAGSKAPSAGNRQPWEFIVVDDPAIIEKIAEQKFQQNRSIAPGPGKTQADADANAARQKNLYKNCTVVAVCHKEGHEQAVSNWMAIENICLAATAEGLGVIPSGFWEDYPYIKEVEKTLGLPDNYELTAMLLIGQQEGYPDPEYPDRSHRADFSWLHKNTYGNTM
ncbi:nitroreductase family protein [Chloroflexota bacterium]